MQLWNTLEANSKPTAQFTVKCGINQGDALSSPVVLQSPWIPLARSSQSGYRYYIDFIKLHARNKRDLDSLIHITRIYSNDIGMSFGPEKCGQMVSKNGKMIRMEGAELLERSAVGVQVSYKFLGIPQANVSHEEAVRKSAPAKYLHRVRQVLKRLLNGKNKVWGINMYALTVIRYLAVLISWPKEKKMLLISRWEGSLQCRASERLQDETNEIQLNIRKMTPKMNFQAPTWHVPPSDRRRGWYQDIIPVAGIGWIERQDRSIIHGSTRVGTSGIQYKINGGGGLPQQTGPLAGCTKMLLGRSST